MTREAIGPGQRCAPRGRLPAVCGCVGIALGGCFGPLDGDASGAAACADYPPQATSPYVLPFPVGRSYLVSQGNCTSFSHRRDNGFAFAYDFDMPIGTLVTATRGGVVTHVRDRFPDFTRVFGEENIVVVRHDDDTYGRYIHLTTNGARVSVGERVEPGDTIALSGDSGLSTHPHLHFDVTIGCSGPTCPTVPVSFRNTQSHRSGLVSGRRYEAEPYDVAASAAVTGPPGRATGRVHANR